MSTVSSEQRRHPRWRSLAVLTRFRALGRPLRRVGPKVFICYRREDTSGYAGRLHDWLELAYPGLAVFLDARSIDAGTQYRDEIRLALESSSVLVALIGRRWSTCVEATGRRRLDDPDDFIVREIAYAFERKVLVVPVLVQGAQIPSSEELPPPIARLRECQFSEIRDSSWSSDFNRFARSLAERLQRRPRRLEGINDSVHRFGRRRLLASVPLVAMIASAGLAVADRAFVLDPLSPALAAARRDSEGRMFRARNDFPEAIRRFRRAVELDTSTVTYQHDLGSAMIADKRWNEAIPVLRLALGRDSTNARLASDLGWAYYRAGRTQDVERMFRAALSLGPGEPEIHRRYGIFLDEHGRWQEVVREYREVVRLAPADHLFRAKLGYVLGSYLHDWQNATEELDKAVQWNPRIAWYRGTRGEAYTHLARWADAQGEFTAATELDPRNAEFFYGKACALHHLGRVGDAVTALNQAVALDPQNAKYSLALSKAREGTSTEVCGST
jgi:Flp pilus assembly protein TadD